MRIGIVGAGSIGSLIAGCLSKTQCDLLLYGRGLHAAHLTVEGLQIEGLVEESIPPNRWEVLLEEHDLPESVHASCDVVVLTGKSSAFDDHLDVAKLLLRNDGIVFTLANGLGHEERLVHAFGAHRVLASTTTHGAYRPEPGLLHWAGRGHVSIGPFMHPHEEATLSSFMQLLSDAGLHPQWEEDGRGHALEQNVAQYRHQPACRIAGKRKCITLGTILV